MARKNGWRPICVLVLTAFALAAGWSCEKSDSAGPTTQSSGGGGAGGATIAVIPKGTTHVFWKSVEAGARKAADEAGVTIVWKGPLKENDRAQQIQIVEQFVAEGVSGIVLAPLD